MIDRKKVIKGLMELHGSKETMTIISDAIALLKEQEAVVRCKDCKHWNAEDHDCNDKVGWFACGADYFCADGERK